MRAMGKSRNTKTEKSPCFSNLSSAETTLDFTQGCFRHIFSINDLPILPAKKQKLAVDKFLWKHINVENVKETDSFYYHKDEQWRGRWVSFTLVYNFGRLSDRVRKSGRGIKNEDRVKEL